MLRLPIPGDSVALDGLCNDRHSNYLVSQSVMKMKDEKGRFEALGSGSAFLCTTEERCSTSVTMKKLIQ